MPRTVLLADDSVTAQNMGRRILMDAGYEVITVNNGSAALKKIHEKQPDLIVLDIYMPGYGGLEVCQRVKESRETMRTPVLLTVGKMEPFKAEEAKRVRADGHIVKPFDASELLAALTKLEDKIVPQAEWVRERQEKTEKKGRLWPTANSAEESSEWNEKISYLAEAKQRQVQAAVEPPRKLEEQAQPEEKVASPAADLDTGALDQQQLTEVSLPAVAELAAASIQEFKAAEDSTPKAGVAQSASNPGLDTVRIESSVASVARSVAAQESPLVKDAPSASAAIAAEPISQAAPEELRPPENPRSRWIAQNVELTAEEASLELEREMQQAQSASLEQVELTAEAILRSPEPDRNPIASESQAGNPPDQEHSDNSDSGAVFAAAAAAPSISSAKALPLAAAESEPEPAVAFETRAAWENWQRIRDSVMSPRSTAAVVDAASEAAREGLSRQAPKDAEPANTPVLESAVLASIVDSVLAELKPRLMEEIAKKLKK
ncbi:MAG: response regulator [Acidobacteria bacterium]|nr:response regulator [Acidobacteriota bacterium]